MAWRRRITGKVVDACTLCDMCFMTKCPYVPPHEFNLDFPHLMLRYRAVERKAGERVRAASELGKTDRNGELRARRAARQLGERPGQHADAAGDGKGRRLSTASRAAEISRPHLLGRAPHRAPMKAPAVGCARRRSTPPASSTTTIRDRRSDAGRAGEEWRRDRGRSIPAAAACRSSRRAISPRSPRRRAGRGVLVPLYRPGLRHRRAGAVLRPDAEIRMAADRAGRSGGETLSRRPSMSPNTSWTSPQGGTGARPAAARRRRHPAHACHARAQNMGQKSAEMLRLFPAAKIDRHRALFRPWWLFGVMKETFERRVKVGKPAARHACAIRQRRSLLGLPARLHACACTRSSTWSTPCSTCGCWPIACSAPATSSG